MPELVLQLTRAGFLLLLWLFVVAALRVVRSDLFVASGLRASLPMSRRGARIAERNRTPRQLVVTAGGLAGTRISLDGRPILIGRADDSTLVLDDDYASTRHARLGLQGGDWFLEDLGSTNGSRLNGHRVEGSEVLKPGDEIELGTTIVRFELE